MAPTGSSSKSPPGSQRQRTGSIPGQQQHRPTVPSGLRQAHMPPSSPEDRYNSPMTGHGVIEGDGIHPAEQDFAASTMNGDEAATRVSGTVEEPTADARTSLLGNGRKYHVPDCGDPNCKHGDFSPRPKWRRGYGSFAPSIASDSTGYSANRDGAADGTRRYRGDFVTGSLNAIDGLLGWPNKYGATGPSSNKAQSKHDRLMYFLYYLPISNWIRQYKWSYVKGDLIAALTMASFYIPMALSYASNLGHIPPINGLYSFVFNPLIYAILGTCPQMVVGPEAAGSLLTGGVVKEAIKHGHHKDHEGLRSAGVAGMVTSLAGAVILAAGVCRLGFLDSVLSRPFLRGFISAIGIVILADQLVPEMGLDTAAAHSQASHGSSLDKIMFLFRHGHEAHKLTCAVAFSTIAIVLVMREIKKRLQPRTPWVAYIPDRFAVVVLSAVLAWKLDWESKGVKILGDIKAKGTPFQPQFPFASKNFHDVDDAFGTSFVIALLGFFESSVAAKSLGTHPGKRKVKKDDGEEEVEEADGIKGMPVSANRELVALGVANLIGGVFMSLPAFGGYGRSKVNASTGGKTPMSSVFLSLITVVCVLFLLPYFYYIPKVTLSAMISVVAYSLIEEAPQDIHFFWSISGYNELALMLLIFLTTFFWNLRIGIVVGIGLSLLRLLKHATRPRIQILGKVPHTEGEYENAEMMPDNIEFVPHCLIVKIPEPLTFANTGSLKDRLRRLEDHGTAHPSASMRRGAPQKPKEHNQNIIFDIHGVTGLDPAASQVLLEIVKAYIERGTSVYFCRIPSRKTEVWRLLNVTGIVGLCGGESHFLRSVNEALRATELQASSLPATGHFVDEEAMVGEGVQTGGSLIGSYAEIDDDNDEGGDGGAGDLVAGMRERISASGGEAGHEVAAQPEHDSLISRAL